MNKPYRSNSRELSTFLGRFNPGKNRPGNGTITPKKISHVNKVNTLFIVQINRIPPAHHESRLMSIEMIEQTNGKELTDALGHSYHRREMTLSYCIERSRNGEV